MLMAVKNLKQRLRLVSTGIKLAPLAFVLTSCLTAIDLEGGFTPSDRPQTVDIVQLDDARAQIGAEQHPRILANYGGEYQDVRISRMIARTLGTLTTVSENPIQSFRVTILDSPSVNAFALPGGYLYITRGLLALANNEAEIAAVISHEMAHVLSNHGIQRQQQQDAAQIAGQVVSEILSGQLSANSAIAKSKLRLAAFSRQQELQADEIGIRMLAEAGYDPDAAVTFLNSIENFSNFQGQNQNVAGLNFLSSHPSTPQRRKAALAHVERFRTPTAIKQNRDGFLKSLDGLTFGENARHGYVRNRSFLHAELGIGFDVPEGFEIDNTSEAVLSNGPNDIATQFDAVEVKPGSTLQSYINDGWIKGLDPTSIAQTSINGLPALNARAEADRWIFDITIIRYREFYYRFLTAVPKTNPSALLIARQIAGSFRVLSRNEIRNLRPLRVRTIKVAQGDTIETLANRMQGTDKKIALFRILNGFSAQAPSRQPLTLGIWVKIIAE